MGNCRKGVIDQPQQGERKDAGGADFVPLLLTSKVVSTGVLARRCTSVLYRCVSEFICPNCRENQNIFTESGQLFDHFCFAETADLGLCNKCSIAKCYEDKNIAFLQLFCVPKFNYKSNMNNFCPD